MHLKPKPIHVDIGRGYDVHIGYGLRHQIGTHLSGDALKGQMAMLTHRRLDRLYGDDVRKGLTQVGSLPVTLRLPEGERHKTPSQILRVYDDLIRRKFERGATLIALGGGVIGDMTGFVAATYLRGIDYIQVPTTVVAQVDASIGGKTGVDHPLGKNLIGAFYQPQGIYIDPEVLSTLAEREYRAGLAEIVKYGVIADADFFNDLERHAADLLAKKKEMLMHCIKRSVSIKAEIVAKDEREAGLRKHLNYGHTLGHAIETATGYRTYKHGEAVSIGMVEAARLSYQLGGLSHNEVRRIVRLLQVFGLPTAYPSGMGPNLLKAMMRDKKIRHGDVYFVLPEKIGCVRVEKIGQPVLRKFLTGGSS